MLKEIRCEDCKKLLAKLKDDDIELKCPRCKKVNKEKIEALEARKQRGSRDEKADLR